MQTAAISVPAIAMAIIQILVAMFQLALALGAPMGEYAFGGQHRGVLPAGYRFGSVISMFVLFGIAGHYFAQAGVLQPLLPEALNSIANWSLVGFNVIGLIMNSISRSKKERQTWVPVLLLSVVLAVIVALG